MTKIETHRYRWRWVSGKWASKKNSRVIHNNNNNDHLANADRCCWRLNFFSSLSLTLSLTDWLTDCREKFRNEMINDVQSIMTCALIACVCCVILARALTYIQCVCMYVCLSSLLAQRDTNFVIQRRSRRRRRSKKKLEEIRSKLQPNTKTIKLIDRWLRPLLLLLLLRPRRRRQQQRRRRGTSENEREWDCWWQPQPFKHHVWVWERVWVEIKYYKLVNMPQTRHQTAVVSIAVTPLAVGWLLLLLLLPSSLS